MSDGQLAKKARDALHATRVLFNTLKKYYEPEGARPKFHEQAATVSFNVQTVSEPQDRFKGLKVNLTLDQWQGPLLLKLRGLATFAPEDDAEKSFLSMVCEISNGTMKKLKFHDPTAKDDPKAEQTKLHQIVLIWETSEGFKVRISKEFLKRYSLYK